MIPYITPPIKKLNSDIFSFVDDRHENLDIDTVASFGKEWTAFNTFSEHEIEMIGADYFDLLPENIKSFIALDVGCGSGRWAAYLAKRIHFVEAIDPSDSIFSAKKLLKDFPNTRVTQASVNTIPFPDSSFDLVYSLGVLHHVPDTQDAIQRCFKKVKKHGYFLLYLYYNFENRGNAFQFIFKITNLMRKTISSLPTTAKKIICNSIAAFIYWPLAKSSSLISLFSKALAEKIPLSYYRKTTFYIMRNDAMDRFGTPLEKRFSKQEIAEMLQLAGFINIRFSQNKPYWHAIAQKP